MKNDDYNDIDNFETSRGLEERDKNFTMIKYAVEEKEEMIFKETKSARVTDSQVLDKLAKMDSVGPDLIQRERMFEEPSETEVLRELNRLESKEERALLNEIITRFTEPVKYKLKFYQIWVLVYIDQLVTLFVNKLLVLRGQLSNRLPDPNKTLSSTHLKIVQFQQTQIKLDLFSKENVERTRVLVYKLNLKAQNHLDQLQSMHHHCVTHQETPDLFCEPFIHKGFRPINQPYSYYAKSLFTKHNETINAWSHYLGAVYTTYCAFHYDFSDPYSWPILVCLITSTIMFVCSATAHLMHQKSHYCHMTCFLCDFGGISFNAFGSALMQVYFVSPIWYFKLLEPYLLPIIGFQSALCILMNSFAQTNFKRPYPPAKRFFQFAPCGMLWGFTMLPLFINYFWPDDNYQMNINFSAHLGHIFVFMLGAFFFAYDFPQRYFPGKLDFFGQGHNLFHMCVFAVVYLHLEACYQDFLANKEIIKASREPPTFGFSFLSLLALIIYYIYVIRLFTKMIAHNFDEQGNLIKKEKVNE